MYTYGNNAMSVDVVETLTAYTDDQLYAIIENSFSSGYSQGMSDYKEQKRKESKLKREQVIDNIKLMLGLFFFMLVVPFSTLIWWIIFGY